MMDVTLLVISLLSLSVSITLSFMAWRVLRDERLRSSARVAALAAEIHDAPLATSVASEMFRAAAPRSRLPLVATVAAILVGLAGAGAILFGRDTGKPVAAGAPSQISHPLAAAPLELIALGHERDADGLTVRGVLRNPSSGAEISQLTAVVTLFNREGVSVGSGRAAVQAATLGPGGETTFVVTISGVAAVERYRVSFRTEHDAVAHVDMRS